MKTSSQRRVSSTLLIACLASALMGVLTLRFADQYQPGMINDDAYYYLGAVSLARTGNYLDLTDPLLSPQRHYTPGYPLLLSGFIKVFGEDVSAARWLSGLFTSFSVGCLFFLGAPLLGIGWALVACGWMALLPATAVWGSALISEAPYLALSLAILALILKQRPAPTWLLALLFAFLFSIRPIGVSLILAYAVWKAYKNDLKVAAAMAGLCLLLLGAHFVWANSGTTSASYHVEILGFSRNAGSVVGWTMAAADKARYYLGELTGTFIPWSALSHVTALALGLLWALLPLAGLAWGATQQLSGPSGLLALYALIYSAIHILVFPSASGRYLFPLLPVLYLLIAAGWKRIMAGRRKWASYLSVWIALSFAVNVWGLYGLARSPRKSLPPPPPGETFAWIKDSAAADAILSADVCAPVTLYVDRPCVVLPHISNPDALLNKLFEEGVDYVLLRESQQIQKVYSQKNAAQRLSAVRALRASPLLARAYDNAGEGTEVFKLLGDAHSYRAAYALYRDGETAAKSGKADQAAALFRQAIARQPRLCDARIYLGSMELGAGRAQNAVPILGEGAKYCPSYPLARISYAKSLGAANQFARARQELEAALELSRQTQGLEADLKIHRQAEALLRMIPKDP